MVIHNLVSPHRFIVSKSFSTSLPLYLSVNLNRIVFDDTEDIFADKITQQALLALNEATAAIMVRIWNSAGHWLAVVLH